MTEKLSRARVSFSALQTPKVASEVSSHPWWTDRRALLQGGAAALAASLAAIPPARAASSARQHLGVCYYPEQWPQSWGPADAEAMTRRGLTYVRLGEFDWALIEPELGRFDWTWFDQALANLQHQGLKAVVGTPTAAPPKWLTDRYPEVLPVAENGQVRGFGARRQYTFASKIYWRESARFVSALIARYGRHPAVAGWQIDNEFGCNDTVLSYGPVDLEAWKVWLRRRYGTIQALNAAWGNAFWSMELSSFDDVVLPVRAVAETDPTARMDYRRFASEQLVAYAAMQAAIVREGSPGRFVTTNAMAFFPDFDHFALGREMDFMSWDSYPLGHTAEFLAGEPTLDRYARTGDPDVPAFNHDLIRGASGGKPFWIMEQQPGPVNWAQWNNVPEPGMVRAWSLEAFAHGADVVSYFRWRQADVAQEEMHAGLNRPDRVVSPGGREAEQVARDLQTLGPLPPPGRAQVALILDYESVWYSKVQPQGADFSAMRLAFDFYTALRRLGLDVDILPPGAALDGYRLVVAPMLAMPSAQAVSALAATQAVTVIGPRTGSKTAEVHIPLTLPPGPLQQLLPLKVTQVASLRPGLSEPVSGFPGRIVRWREWLETDLPALAAYEGGEKAVVAAGRRIYVSGWPDATLATAILSRAASQAGLAVTALPEDLRLRRRGAFTFVVNYGPTARTAPIAAGGWVLGSPNVAPYSVSVARSV